MLTQPLFFGVWSPTQKGHFLHGSGGHTPASSERLARLDQGFCRGVKNRWGEVDPTQQIEGLARLHFVDGYTVLAFWDRSGDNRYGSNSAFLVPGRHAFADAVRLAREAFPSIWARFTFPVVLEGPDLLPEVAPGHCPGCNCGSRSQA